MPKHTNVLVVENEATVRSLIYDVLTNSGYNVHAVESGEEAIEKVKGISFEIVITDLKMPGMSGFEVIRKLKEVDPSICIIVVTAYPSIETVVEAMREGAYDYIAKPFHLDEFRIIVGRAAEKQSLKQEKDTYKELSITDGLTGIYNHRHFQEVLTREIDRAMRYTRPLSLAMIDIDDFKVYNDTHSHLAGDEILKNVARIINESVRKIDFAFRYGGEEFAVLLPETNKEGAMVVGKRIRRTLEQTQFKYGEVFPSGRLTVSIGLSIYPDDAASKRELVLRGDEAMYQAKRLGKNRVCFYEIKEIKAVVG